MIRQENFVRRIRKVVRNMKGKSGPGADGIQAILIKRSLNVILPVLVY